MYAVVIYRAVSKDYIRINSYKTHTNIKIQLDRLRL